MCACVGCLPRADDEACCEQGDAQHGAVGRGSLGPHNALVIVLDSLAYGQGTGQRRGGGGPT